VTSAKLHQQIAARQTKSNEHYVQEYEKINRPLLDCMTQMGSESATVSDACRAWLTIGQHYARLTPADLSRISSRSAADLTQLQALMATRVKDGLTDVHYLALLLDPRPSMRTFVESSGLLGNPADQTMGNTPALQAAQNALRHMACAIDFDGKTKAEVGTALSKALLVFCNVSALASYSS
jgi:hypothetical protein